MVLEEFMWTGMSLQYQRVFLVSRGMLKALTFPVPMECGLEILAQTPWAICMPAACHAYSYS